MIFKYPGLILNDSVLLNESQTWTNQNQSLLWLESFPTKCKIQKWKTRTKPIHNQLWDLMKRMSRICNWVWRSSSKLLSLRLISGMTKIQSLLIQQSGLRVLRVFLSWLTFTLRKLQSSARVTDSYFTPLLLSQSAFESATLSITAEIHSSLSANQ